jgi:hypothetical protein
MEALIVQTEFYTAVLGQARLAQMRLVMNLHGLSEQVEVWTLLLTRGRASRRSRGGVGGEKVGTRDGEGLAFPESHVARIILKGNLIVCIYQNEGQK